MSKSRLLASVALAALCLPVAALSPSLPFGATAAQAQSVNVNFQLFFDQLQPHGVWVRHDRYQYVFCPTGIDAQWRPYTNGRWLYLEGRGWYFASDEPHAWATYHYGRWFADQDLGWCWVPGNKWAPAWVSWRRSDDIVGWAPLPPESDGYAVSLEISRRELPSGYWVYVPTRSFVEPELSLNIVFGNAQPQYYTQTQFLGPVVIEGDVVVNNVIEVNYIEQVIGQQVVVFQPEAAASPAEQSVTVDAQVIAVFDQDVAEPDAEAAPPEAVEEADAVDAIAAEGGTAGATAEIAAEGEAGAAAEPAEDAAVETDADAAVDAQADAAVPAEAAEADAEAAATGDAAAEVGTESDPEAPQEVDPTSQDVTAEEQPADADAQDADAPQAVEPEPAPEDVPPAEETVAPEPEEAPPADEPAVEEAVPAEDAAPAEEAVPAEGEAAVPAEGAATEELACLPEELVDGKCPPLPQN